MTLAGPRVSNWWGQPRQHCPACSPPFSVFIQTGRTCEVPPDITLRFIMPMLFSPKAKTLSGYTPLRYHRNASSFAQRPYEGKNGVQKIVVIQTDYTCIPFWEETDCDYYIIPHYELIDEFAAKEIPRERLMIRDSGSSGIF